MSVVLGFRDIFNEEEPNINDLLELLPLTVVVAITSVINGELHATKNRQESQIKLFKFLLMRQEASLRFSILENLMKYEKNNKSQVFLFSNHVSLELLHQSLIHKNEEIREISTQNVTSEQELTYFKAYVLASSLINDQTRLVEAKTPFDYLKNNFWPNLIMQLEINNSSNPICAMVKAKCFLDFLEYESEYGKYVDRFLSFHKFESSWAFVFTLINVIQKSISARGKSELSPFYIKANDEIIQGVLEEMAIDALLYRQEFISGIKAYLGFKKKPLCKIGENHFLVIDWNLFINKIYNGLLFDFWERSSINDERKFSNFVDFKGYIGQNSVEGYLFTNLIKGVFSHNEVQIHFSQSGETSWPDAYVRIGKRIILFELKDTLFSSDVIESSDHDKVQGEIDKKYNMENKGTGQLFKNLIELSKGTYSQRDEKYSLMKQRNAIVYPVLIYTDMHFKMNGFATYLKDEFARRIKNEGFEFQKIEDLTFMSLDDLIDNFDIFSNTRNSFITLIDSINRFNRKTRTRLERSGDILEYDDSFDFMLRKIKPQKRRESIDKRTIKLFQDLNLDKGLKE